MTELLLKQTAGGAMPVSSIGAQNQAAALQESGDWVTGTARDSGKTPASLAKSRASSISAAS